SVKYNDKVIVPSSEYNMLISTYGRYSKAIELEKYIKENYLGEVDEEKLFDGQLKGMFEALGDPYSTYMNVDEFKGVTEETEGIYGGIGIIVTPGEDSLITVVSPIEDTPGERAG